MFRKLVTLLAVPAIASAQVVPQMPQAQKQGSADSTFRPISLADALRLAKENNVSNITAANSVRNSNLLVRSARAQLYPSVSATAGQGISAGDRVGQSGTLVPYTPAWTYTTGLTVNQTLFDAGKSFADVRARKADVLSAEANQVSQEFQVGLNVKQQYNAVLAAKELETAARAQLELANQQCDDERRLHERQALTEATMRTASETQHARRFGTQPALRHDAMRIRVLLRIAARR